MKKYNRTNVILFLLIALTLPSCTNSTQSGTKMTISETDRYYSALSAQKGMNTAFLAMFDSAGVMLTSNQMPVEGHQAISRLLANSNDSSFVLTWEPTFEKVAVSGELGYSYGIFTVTDKTTRKKTGEGTYTTIWQKNASGEWKAMLDTGNDGLGNK